MKGISFPIILRFRSDFSNSLFWTATSLAILNYPTDIYEYVRSGQVTVHRKDISHLSYGTVNFTDGTSIHSDAMSAVTGWRFDPTLTFLPAGIDSELGIPSLNYTDEQNARWNALDEKADNTILRRFPYLKNGPKVSEKSLEASPQDQDSKNAAVVVEPADKNAVVSTLKSWSPYRLYRGVAPPGLTAENDRSLVFLKMVSSTSNMIVAEVQALWSFAYLERKLDIDTSSVEWETALAARFGKHRYPCGFGARYPDFVFDSIPYADLLLGDLGVKNRRKVTWKKELLEGYSIHDYKGINKEWLAAH